eukprot:gene13292-16654_t
MVEMDLAGPTYSAEEGPIFTRTDWDSKESALYDFFLTRGISVSPMTVHWWEQIKSDHRPVEIDVEFELPHIPAAEMAT